MRTQQNNMINDSRAANTERVHCIVATVIYSQLHCIRNPLDVTLLYMRRQRKNLHKIMFTFIEMKTCTQFTWVIHLLDEVHFIHSLSSFANSGDRLVIPPQPCSNRLNFQIHGRVLVYYLRLFAGLYRLGMEKASSISLMVTFVHLLTLRN